jgi:hypothetical protein
MLKGLAAQLGWCSRLLRRLRIHFGNETARRLRQMHGPAGGSRSFAQSKPNHKGQEHVMATNKPVGDNTRKGAVKKRSQLATKTMGKKTFTKRNKEGGQFMAQKKKAKFKGVRKER